MSDVDDTAWVRTQLAWLGLVDADGAPLADERQLAGLAADHRALRAAVDALHEAVRAAPDTAPALVFDPVSDLYGQSHTNHSRDRVSPPVEG